MTNTKTNNTTNNKRINLNIGFQPEKALCINGDTIIALEAEIMLKAVCNGKEIFVSPGEKYDPENPIGLNNTDPAFVLDNGERINAFNLFNFNLDENGNIKVNTAEEFEYAKHLGVEITYEFVSLGKYIALPESGKTVEISEEEFTEIIRDNYDLFAYLKEEPVAAELYDFAKCPHFCPAI